MPPVGFDNRPADSQSQPHSIWFRCKKGFETLECTIARNAATGVADTDFLDVVSSLGSDRDLVLSRVGPADRFRGVSNQVQKDLLHLNPVGLDHRRQLIQLDGTCNAVVPKIIFHQCGDFADNTRQVRVAPSRLEFPDKILMRWMICPAQ